jgi:hypothetical protein
MPSSRLGPRRGPSREASQPAKLHHTTHPRGAAAPGVPGGARTIARAIRAVASASVAAVPAMGGCGLSALDLLTSEADAQLPPELSKYAMSGWDKA